MKAHQLYLAILCVFLSGCMTAQDRRDKRITQNIDLFYEYTEEERAKIRRGQIDIGFNENMVFLAIGKADRVGRRKNAEGESVTWQYSSYSSLWFWHDSHASDLGGWTRKVSHSIWLCNCGSILVRTTVEYSNRVWKWPRCIRWNSGRFLIHTGCIFLHYSVATNRISFPPAYIWKSVVSYFFFSVLL